MTGAPQHIPKCKEWHVHRFIEEMDEAYYYVIRNDEFFCKCPSEEIANTIITACSRPLQPQHPDALAFTDRELGVISLALPKLDILMPDFCDGHTDEETLEILEKICKMKATIRQKQEARK